MFFNSDSLNIENYSWKRSITPPPKAFIENVSLRGVQCSRFAQDLCLIITCADTSAL